MERQAFILEYDFFVVVQSNQVIPVFTAQRCCLRCGRVVDVGAENIDSCEDCRAMAFTID